MTPSIPFLLKLLGGENKRTVSYMMEIVFLQVTTNLTFNAETDTFAMGKHKTGKLTITTSSLFQFGIN